VPDSHVQELFYTTEIELVALKGDGSTSGFESLGGASVFSESVAIQLDCGVGLGPQCSPRPASLQCVLSESYFLAIN